MGTMVGMRNELGTLEIGLKDLKRSRLMGIQEFKDMYGAIERHYRDLRLAHLTGKEKDLLTQAQRDTKFFHVLIKMLCEVKQLRTGKQKESLKKVYTWYMANRHTLSSRPHFGKSYQMKEACDFRQKITNSPRKSSDKKEKDKKVETVSMARLSSAEGFRQFFKSVTPSSSKMGRDSPAKGAPVIFELPSNKDYVNEYLTSRFLDMDTFTSQVPPYQTETSTSRLFSGVQVHNAGVVKSEEFNALSSTLMDGPDDELQDLIDGDLFPDADVKFDNEDPAHIQSSRNVDEASNVSPRYIDSLINESYRDSQSIDTEDLPNTEDMEFPEGKRKLSRGQTPTASLRGAMTDQSSNVSIVLPKKMIHPIASLVNPHAQLAAMEAKRAEEEYLATRENMTPSVRGLSSKSRPTDSAVFKATSGQENLHNWKSFNKDWAYGQDILRGQTYRSLSRRKRGKLNFVGRSGTAVDVRYTAHDNAEMPESHTQNVVAFYAAQSNDDGPVKVLGPVQVDQQGSLTDQSLEDFYKLTDNYYPVKLPKYRPYSSKAKTSSPSKEPADKQRKMESKPPVPKLKLLGKNLLPNESNAEKNSDQESSRSDVKIDDVVNMIDDVTDDMTYFKEMLAPRPHPGFRHPASTGVSMLPLSRPSTANSASRPSTAPQRPSTAPQRPSTATGIRTASPVQRSNTPTDGEATKITRPNPFAGRDILIPSPDTPTTLTPKPTLSSPVNKVVQAIDWRGKITPDSVRYKWQATKFGGHTYVKKLMSGRRPVGATHGGSRPRTAPASTKDRWKTEKPSDNNTRISSQAATHNMTQVDQEAVDSMLIINHLVGSSDSKMGSLNSLLLDENFLRSFNTKHLSTTSTVTNTPVPMEYVSIISRPRSVVDSRTQSRQTRQSDRPESQTYQELDEEEALGGSTNTTPRAEESLPVPQLKTDQICLHIPATGPGSKVTAESSERPADAEEVVQNKTTQTVTFQEPTNDEEDVDKGRKSGEKEESGAVNQVELKSTRHIIQGEESDAGTTTPTSSATSTLIHRPVEYHSEDLHDGEVHIEVTGIPSGGRAPTPPDSREGPIQELTKSEEWNFSPGGKVRGVSAGEIVDSQQRKVRINSSCLRSDNWTKYITAVKPETYCFDCIPDSMSTKVGRTAGRMPSRTQSASSQVLRMARKQNEYYKNNPPLRTPPSIPSSQHSYCFRESPRYGQTFNSELEHHARKIQSPRRFMEEVVDLRKNVKSAPAGFNVQADPLSASLHVCRIDGPSKENTEIGTGTGGRVPQSILREFTQEELGLPRETTEEGLKRVGFKMEYDDINNTERKGLPAQYLSSRSQSNVSLAHRGRPIPQYTHIGDPDEVAAAVERQKEAKAAVDIQRIFRGYVARIHYKKLLKEERERMEDEQMMYNDSQRKYKEHLNSKAEIYNRPNRSSEMSEWSNKVKKIQDDKAEQRQKKMESLSEKNTKNYMTASSKISTIGPHVNIYQIYHPKKVGPTKRELHFSATHIQKCIRGFLVRKRFEKLRRKAKLYGTTWKRLVKDYKGTLARCQMRHGVDRPKTPFTIQDMNDYMDARRRYESVFEKKAFGSELEVADMESFFKECDLYPSMAEIEHGLDVILQGQLNKRRGLKKNEMLELVFYIYVPKATNLTNTRQSTWINPIIDGVEAKKLMGSEFVEPAPLEKCAKIVMECKRMRKQKEKEEREKEQAELLKSGKKVKKCTPGEDFDSDDSN